MNRLHTSFCLVLALMTGGLFSGCQSNSIELGMSKESLQAKYGPPKRKEVSTDGREEWFYDTQIKKKNKENFSNPAYVYPGTSEELRFQLDVDEETSGVTFSTKLITTERAVSISPDGKVEGIPNGTILPNR